MRDQVDRVAQAPLGAPDDMPQVIPQVELRGSRVERLNAIDAMIARLRELRRALAGENEHVPFEVYGPYINAPVWPWTVAGWTMAAIFLLLFLITWLGS
jgi:hypothetical protein